MNNLEIKGTYNTPTVEFDFIEGDLLISGRSLPENSIEFYEPLISALENYNNNPARITNVDFKLEYFNTSSSKSILNILRLLQKIHSGKGDVVINWYHDKDDDEILEIGHDYSLLTNMPFNIKMTSEN